jgi:hypothetical protein
VVADINSDFNWAKEVSLNGLMKIEITCSCCAMFTLNCRFAFGSTQASGRRGCLESSHPN